MPRKPQHNEEFPPDRKDHTPGGIAFTAFVVELFRLNGKMITVGDRMTGDLGMTSARWQVLGAIGREAKTVAEAARVMGLTRQNVQRIADWLVESGMAEFIDNPNHRRAKLVTLTPKGVAMRQRINRRQAKWANDVAAHLTVAEIDAAIEVMKRVGRRLG